MRYARKLWRRETINTLGSWEAVRSRTGLPEKLDSNAFQSLVVTLGGAGG